MIGSVLSHYRILSPLGAGGMGVVYLAEDLRLGRHVAIKFLPPEAAKSPQALERFHLEARAVSLLSHPGICALYDIGIHEGAPFLVMERLRGETLRARLARGRLSVPEVLDIGIQLAEALEAAHAQGIVHRDIKPANIWVGEKLRVKILDFGLAKLAPSGDEFGMSAAEGDEDHATRVVSPRIENPLTMPGMAIGTALYMSPEQARGEVVDARTDIFSLGVVLYEMLTGQQAFAGSTAAVVFDAILNRVPVPPAVHNPEIPGRLQDVIQATLEKRREDRLPSAAQLETELARIRREVRSTVGGRPASTLVHPAAATAPGVEVTAPTLAHGTGASDATMVVPPPDAPTRAGVAASKAETMAATGAVTVSASVAATMAEAATAPPRPTPWPVALAAVAVAAAVAVWAINRTTPGSATPPTVAELVTRAEQRLAAHDLRGALVEAGAALTYDATNANAARIKGDAEAGLAKLDAAVAAARTALGRSDWAAAGAALEAAQALAPGDPTVISIASQLGRSASATPAAAPPANGTTSAPAANPPPPGPSSREAGNATRLSTAPTTAASSPSAPWGHEPAPRRAAATASGPAATLPIAASTAAAPAASAPEPLPVASSKANEAPPAESRGAVADTAPPSAPRPPPPVERETDEAGVRRALEVYGQAIENKDLSLFRTVRPHLSQDEEKRLRASFQQIERQHVELRIETMTVMDDRAEVRVSREDTIESGGRAQRSRSTQTFRMARRGAAWIIVSLGR